MNERQAASGSDGTEPDADRTPDEDKGFELPPPPAAGALWASSPAGGRASVTGGSADSGAGRFSSSTRPISAMPSAGAARATVPGALTVDDAGMRALTWPTGGSKIYGGKAAPELSQPDRPEPEQPEPVQPEPVQPEPGYPEPQQPEPEKPEPEQPRPSQPWPGEPSKPAEPVKPFDPPAPVEPPPGPFPTPTPSPSPTPPGPGPGPGPGPSPDPGPGPVPPGPGPSPVPPGPGPSPVPPGPGPSPVPPGPGPSPVPGPPVPIFPPPPMLQSPAGLPAYTMPPMSPQPPVSPQPPTGAAAPYEHHTPGRHPTQSEPQHDQTIVASPPPGWNQPSGTPYGVGSPGAVRQPFGGPAAQVSTPPARQTTYGQSSTATPPQQRGEGTVYGAQNPADMTMPVSMNAIDNSGSLTGHILAQGWDRGEDTGRRSNVKVGIAMVAVLLFLVGVSLLFLFTAGDAFTDMVNGVFNKE